MPKDTDMNEKKLGSTPYNWTTDGGVEVLTTSWKDRKYFHFGSSFACEEPKWIVRRYNKSTKTYIHVDWSFVVFDYKRHMGWFGKQYY